MKPTYREKNLLDYLFGGFRSTLKRTTPPPPSLSHSPLPVPPPPPTTPIPPPFSFLILLSPRLLRSQSVQEIVEHFQNSSNTTNPSPPPPCALCNFSKPSQRFQHRSLTASSPPLPPFATLPTPSHLLQQHSLLSSSASFRNSFNTTEDKPVHLFQPTSSNSAPPCAYTSCSSLALDGDVEGDFHEQILRQFRKLGTLAHFREITDDE